MRNLLYPVAAFLVAALSDRWIVEAFVQIHAPASTLTQATTRARYAEASRRPCMSITNTIEEPPTRLATSNFAQTQTFAPVAAAQHTDVPVAAQRFTYDADAPVVVWTASTSSRKRVMEGPRSLLAYLSLPPSSYSLLDPRQIERVSQDEFRCSPGALNFFGNSVSPVVYLRVVVDEGAGRVNIEVTRVELEGSPAIRSASDSFTCKCSNVVTCGPKEPSGKRMLSSQVDLRIEVSVPRENWVPLRVLRSTGSFIMQRAFDLFVPQFLRYLSRDYKQWSQGSDERAPVVDTDAEAAAFS